MTDLVRTAGRVTGGRPFGAALAWDPFRNFFTGTNGFLGIDVTRTDDGGYSVEIPVAGFKPEKIDVTLEDDVLTLSGERKVDHESKGEGFYRVERATGAFSRSLTLPEGVDGDAIAARFDKGVLEVRIPKPERRRPRKLQISVGDAPAEIEGRAAEQAATS